MGHQDASTPVDKSTNTMARELDSRMSDGIEITLLWRPSDNHVSVAVNDARKGEAFKVEVRPGQRALDVFHHPYAYATQSLRTDEERGVDRVARMLLDGDFGRHTGPVW